MQLLYEGKRKSAAVGERKSKDLRVRKEEWVEKGKYTRE